MSSPLPMTNPAVAPAASPLDQLADIHLPEPVSAFPWAVGWWLLIGLVTATLLLIVWWWRRRHRALAWRRAALEELAHIDTLQDNRAFATALNQLLRRVAIQRHGITIAGLTGSAWLSFLRDTADADFDEACQHQLLQCCYADSSTHIDRPLTLRQCRNWIRRQTRPAANATQEARHA
jgi:hypothetical protein